MRGSAIDFVAEVLGVDVRLLSRSSRLNGMLEWDSLAHVAILVRLEEIGVQLDDDVMFKAESIAGIAELLEEVRNGGQ